MTVEVNFDGLVGPTHNYAGLSVGNRASLDNAGRRSNPRRAALQGLAKMRRLLDLGLTQGVLPPPLRPDPEALRRLGLAGCPSLAAIADEAPELVPLLMSASSMWAANAATVSPSLDTADGRLHLTPANLWSTPHRAIESTQTERILGRIFADDAHFVVHPALPAVAPLADEGAANHGRLAAEHGQPGLHVFVYGREAAEPVVEGGVPRRQSLAASRMIARSHGLDPTRVVFVRQSAHAVEAGAFHNDVVAVTNGRVLFAHEHAFADPDEAYRRLDAEVVAVGDDEVPLADAISSYLFNSQLVTLPSGLVALVAPTEVWETPSTDAYLRAALANPHNPISEVHAMDLRESMHNGGGPACLRLRVVMTGPERRALLGRVLVDNDLLDELESWVERNYRDELAPDDLIDPELGTEVIVALDELSAILRLPGLYDF